MSKRTIDLSDAGERALHDLAQALGTGSEEATLALFLDALLPRVEFRKRPDHSSAPGVPLTHGPNTVRVQIKDAEGSEPVSSAPTVMGGDACVRRTRIPIWMLVEYKRQGLSDSELLVQFPGLNAADLSASWDYYAAHSEEVDAQKARHDAA